MVHSRSLSPQHHHSPSPFAFSSSPPGRRPLLKHRAPSLLPGSLFLHSSRLRVPSGLACSPPSSHCRHRRLGGAPSLLTRDPFAAGVFCRGMDALSHRPFLSLVICVMDALSHPFQLGILPQQGFVGAWMRFPFPLPLVSSAGGCAFPPFLTSRGAL